MIEARRHNIQSSPPSSKEVEFMTSLREKGYSYGAIGEELFETYGYTLDPRNIRKLIKKGEGSARLP